MLGRAVRRGSLPLARGRTGRLSAAQLRDGGLGRHLFGRPRKAPLFRVPLPFQSSGGRARLPARKFPAFSRKFCLDAPFGAARFPSQEAELDGFQPPSFAMAALAAICSAAPEKLRFSGFPCLFNPQAGRARLPARKFPAFSRKFCLDAPFGAARFPLARGRTGRLFSRPASRWRPWPPSVRPLFCCGLYRSPRGCRSGPPPRKSACRGRGPPRR